MSATNREILERLFREDGINLVRGPIFDQAPPPLAADFDFGKVEGMMLGLAVSDALGNTSEGQLPSVRRGRHGEIRDYLPNRYADGKRVGLPSDDTQLAFWTLEQMLEDDRFVPAHVAERFSRSRIYGIGSIRARICWKAARFSDCNTGRLAPCRYKVSGNGLAPCRSK